MYGTQHFLLSFFTVLILTYPLLYLTGDLSLLLIPIVAGFGSLMPDIDVKKTDDPNKGPAITHPKILGLQAFIGKQWADYANIIYGLLWIVVYPILNWFIFPLYCWRIGIKREACRHRGEFHSEYAALFTAFWFTVILSGILFFFLPFSILFSIYLFFGVFLGFSLHLVEDACINRTAINFLYPIKPGFYVNGKQTMEGRLIPTFHIILLMILAIAEIALMFFPFLVGGPGKVLNWLLLGDVSLLIIWAVFLKFPYGVKCDNAPT